jgi:hypothetical protein
MANDRFEQALATLDPNKRALLKRIVAGAAFVVPAIASFAVADLAYGQIGSCSTSTATSTVTISDVTTTTTVEGVQTTTTTTATGTVTATVTSLTTITVTVIED